MKYTIIIPIYNQARNVFECIKALKKQSLKFKGIEVILINDGSTDNSDAICQSLTRKYPNIRYFSQSNRGVSSARNLGLKHATGKYIFFLDADDSLERHTLEKVSDFFDSVYDEVDLVTYPIETIYKGKRLEPHFRYRYLTESGVYDLRENPYIGQTTMNIVVKNRFDDNIMFDEEQTFSEDQRYCCDVLARTLKMGFCREGKYIYYRSNNSSSGRLSGACFIFEQCMDFFEELFSRYDNVPAAFQGLYVNDIYWKMCSNILFPYHYAPSDYEYAMERIRKLLARCENIVILEHPHMDFFEKYYLLRLKSPNALQCEVNRNYFGLRDGSRLVITERNMEIVITKFQIHGRRLEILGFIKSVFLQFWDDEVTVCAVENDGKLTRKLSLYDSSHNYYQSHEKTQKFRAFRYRTGLDGLQKVRFEVGFRGLWFPTHFYFMPRIPLSHRHKRYKVEFQGYTIRLTPENELCFERLPETLPIQKAAAGRDLSGNHHETTPLKNSRERIWLYSDCIGVKSDNGMLQFLHDIKKNDGIRRYYIVTDKRQRSDRTSQDSYVDFGSRKHKQLLEKCEMLFTAYIEESNIFPYTVSEIEKLAPKFQFEVIYLQHGVLHIKMPWKFSPEKIMADRIVVSTREEKALFMENGFSEDSLIGTGMARFEILNKTAPKKKKILLAPSWRGYLAGNYIDHKWEPLREKFLASTYYKEIQRFLSSPGLTNILAENGYTLDVKLHPIFAIYADEFNIDSPYIRFVSGRVPEEDYSLFITDFSSFMYDFIYLDTPVMNFIPDIMEFKSGMNGYRELNYSPEFWEKTACTAEELLHNITLYFQGKWEPFSSAHFFDIDDCREDLYSLAISGDLY